PHATHPDLHSFPTRRSSDLDANKLDAGGHLEGNRGLVGERELQEILGDRRGQMTAGHAAAEIARLVETDIDADHEVRREADEPGDRKSTRLNSSHQIISYAV